MKKLSELVSHFLQSQSFAETFAVFELLLNLSPFEITLDVDPCQLYADILPYKIQ